MAHVFVADLDHPAIAEEDRHHLERVLRLRAGEAVTASDGAGGLRRCRFVLGGELEAVGDVVRQPARTPRLAVGFALVKGEKPEWVVQKLTECGIDDIVPFVGARSVVRWDRSRAGRHLERLRRVAREAAMQSHQAWLPEVWEVATFAGVAARQPSATALADRDGGAPSLRTPTVLVGPEGGWSSEERATEGLVQVSFGPSVLRAETAAMAAGVVLSALRAGTVAEPDRRPTRST